MRFAAGLLSGAALTFAATAWLNVHGLPEQLRQQATILMTGATAAGAPADLPSASLEPPSIPPTVPEPVVGDSSAGGSAAHPAAPDPTPAIDPDPIEAATGGLPTEAEAARRPGTEFVWQAFRSEMSARGFARHLQENLDHRLEVQKAAPGQYLVGFRYESAAERDQVLHEIAEIMGSAR
jgi:hypothetical protein